jgi:CheY-like chemotaxis protein
MPGKQKPRILIAEDEYFISTEIVEELEAAGGEAVGPVGNYGDAVSNSHDGIDGALLDINLRGCMVFELADQLRRSGLPIAFISGYDRTTLPETFADVPLISKPYSRASIAGIAAWIVKAAANTPRTNLPN